MIRFKIFIVIVNNGERFKIGFADPNGKFYPFNSRGMSDFDLTYIWEFLSARLRPMLSYDNFDTSYLSYQIKESDEIFLEEFVYI